MAVPILVRPAFHRIGAPVVAALEQAGPENRDDVRKRGELGRRGLAAFGVAAVVLDDELDRMAGDLVADVVECDFDAALRIESERRVGA